MRSERGQATVEWAGLLLLVALVLLAVAHVARSADGKELGSTMLAAQVRATRAAPGGAPGGAPANSTTAPRVRGAAPGGTWPDSTVGAQVRAPEAVPVRADGPGRRRAALPREVRAALPRELRAALPRELRAALPRELRAALPRELRAALPRELRAALPRAGRAAGAVWGKAWFACLVYERIRYGLRHPESRLPGYTFPYAVAARIVAGCVSPVDLLRDLPAADPGP